MTGGGLVARLTWWWCLIYTAPVPGPQRARRRDEMLSHLFESGAAGVPPRALAWATTRGLLSDLSWALRRAGRAYAVEPAAWILAAACLPVGALAVSTFATGTVAGNAELIGMVGSLGLLGVAGLVALGRRQG